MEKRAVITNLRGAVTPDPSRTWAVDYIEKAAIALNQGRIAWLGPAADLPLEWQSVEKLDGKGRWASPGFVDPHTHLLFGGDRSQEFNRRLHGDTYAQIASEGGGIRETVRATRQASLEELTALGQERLQKLSRKGVVHLDGIRAFPGIRAAAPGGLWRTPKARLESRRDTHARP
jgi:imidazolonepropionase